MCFSIIAKYLAHRYRPYKRNKYVYWIKIKYDILLAYTRQKRSYDKSILSSSDQTHDCFHQKITEEKDPLLPSKENH